MNKRMLYACAFAIAAIVVLAVGVDAALAATSKVGRNVGKEVETWAKGLLLGVAVLVGIPALAKRNLGEGLVIALLVVMIGGFVFAGGAVKQVIGGLWKALGG